MPLPKAISFDVGWTLVYPRQSMWALFAEVCRDAGVASSARDVEDLVHGMMAMSRERAMQGFVPDAEHSDSDAEFAALFGLMGQLIFTSAGAADDAAQLSTRFLERFWTAENWVVFPDVLPALDTLRRRGIRVGVLSNASSELVGFLDQLGLAPLLDFTVVSAVEGRKKPDRRLYEVALRRAGTAPSDTAHVGDMYVEDVLGARNVGVRPFLIERGPHAMFPHHPESIGLPNDDVQRLRSLEELLLAIGVESDQG